MDLCGFDNLSYEPADISVTWSYIVNLVVYMVGASKKLTR